MSDRERLAGYVETWWQAVQELTALLEQVPDEQWSTPTDLAGWDVRACAAHTAHLESVLAGNPEETADVGEPPHVAGFMGLYTEIGVVNRRDRGLRTDRESFVVLSGGRRTPAPGAVTVEGDEELGARVVSLMATTP